nr:MAG TPA: hypothetical protein [Caudoviricetes sp.]
MCKTSIIKRYKNLLHFYREVSQHKGTGRQH